MLRQSFAAALRTASAASSSSASGVIAPSCLAAARQLRSDALSVRRRHYSEAPAAQTASSSTDAKGKGPANDASDATELQKQVEQANTALEKKDKEIAQLKVRLSHKHAPCCWLIYLFLPQDKYIRGVADYENLQKITKRETQQAKAFAVEKLAKELIEHLDILHLALNTVPSDKRTKTAGSEGPDHLADLYTGVSMTSGNIEKTLSRFDVTPFDPTGEKFNPSLHEALYQAPVPGKDPNTVLETQKKGWMMRDRVLRAAQVGVVADTS